MSKFEELEKRYFTENELKKLHAEGERLARLSQVRRARSVTQTDVAHIMQIGQAAVSQIENQHDAKLSTLKAYVKALGGELKLVAQFDGTPVTIVFGDEPEKKTRGAQPRAKVQSRRLAHAK